MQWKLPGSLCPKKAQQWHIKIKTMLTVFFDLEGIIHHKYAPPGQTINKKHYSMSFIGWEMQYDENSHGYRQLVTGSFITNNMPTHASHLVQSLLAKHQITQVTQPPYSPDLVPYNFWLFPKLKSPLKGKRFQTINEIQKNMTGKLMAIPVKDFCGVFGTVEETLGELCEVPRCLLWRWLRHYFPMYSVSCIFFSNCLYFL